MWRHDDQAATLRRWFRRDLPPVFGLFVASTRWARDLPQLMRHLVRAHGPVLLADEASATVTLPEASGAPRPPDLLLSLQEQSALRRLLLRLPDGWGYLNLKAAAVAMPLLGEEQRQRLLATFQRLSQPFRAVVCCAGGGSAADASWWVTSAPAHGLLVEPTPRGAELALRRSEEIAPLGISRITLIAADGATPRFLRLLAQRITARTSLPVTEAQPLQHFLLPTLPLIRT